jgi:hypothetical protein
MSSVILSKNIFSLRERAPSAEDSLQFDYTGDVFSFTPSVTDPDGPDLVAFDTWVAATRGPGQATLSDAGTLRPSWMTATLTKNLNSDGSADGTVRFSFEKGGMPDGLEVLRVGCYVEDGAGQSKTEYFDYWPEEDLAFHNVMGQEDKFREDAVGGGNARAVVTTGELSTVKIYWGPYEESFSKSDLTRELPFQQTLKKKHEIIWAGLSVNQHYGFYLEALTPHGQNIESGIYEFTTGDEVSVWSRNLRMSFVEGWEKEMTVDGPFLAFFDDLTTSTRSELEDAYVENNITTSLHVAWEKQIQDTIEANNFDSNISTSTSHEIN